MLRKGFPVTNVYLFKNKLWLNEFSTRMHDWLEGKKRAPIKIDAELHRRCNLKCKFCSRRESKVDMTEESKELEVPKERWIEVAEESGKMGVKAWNISGIGEPMCKPDLTLSVMKKLKEYDVFGEITTNGTLWDEEKIKKTVKMGWDSVSVSLDSPKKETHNKLREAKAFDKAVRTLSLFQKWKKELNSKKPTITINVVLNKQNYDQMTQLFLLGKDLGVDSIFIEPLIVYTEEGEKLKLDKDEIREFQGIAEECKYIAKKYGIEPNINCYTEDKEFDDDLVNKTSEMKEVIEEDSEQNREGFKDPDKTYDNTTDDILSIPCYYPWFYMIITADGSASHCGEKVNKSENIREKNLNDIWFGEEFKSDRERFKEKDLPDYCNRCRPNVVGDARRIRKAILELRDKEYLLNSISEVEYMNDHIKDKLTMLRESERSDFEKCGDDCNHKEELENLKNSKLYRICSKISENKVGKVLKRNYHQKTNSKIQKDMEREEKDVEELKKILIDKLEKNKQLKDILYSLKEQKDIYENLEDLCEHKKELIELKDSLTFKLMD